MSNRTLGQVLQSTIASNGNRTAIVESECSWNWHEFGVRTAKAAAYLGALGLTTGDRFIIVAQNSRRLEELRWAGFYTGIIPVPVNWRLAPPEIKHILEDTEGRIIFADEDFLKFFDNPILSSWRDGVQTLSHDYDDHIDEMIPAEPTPCEPDDDAILYYTGGTTGRSKGVRLSHWNIISCGLAYGFGVGARSTDTFLHVAPMFHSADLLAMAWFINGSCHSYLPRFTPGDFLEAITNYKVTTTVTVPSMLMATITYPDFAKADFSSLRMLIYGASPMAFEWIQRVAQAFPDVEFVNCYGLTETSPDLTIFNAQAFRRAIESGDRKGSVLSVGKPNVLIDLRVVDQKGEDVPAGQIGELWARGPNVMKGYLNLPDETTGALSDGWLHTGDIARIDDEGYVYLLDRLKDMIITGGENVYSSEVEVALHQHPAVSEAAVIGVADEKLGEALFAVIVLRENMVVDEMELIEHCRPLIGGYKIPRNYAFVEVLPKSALGKPLKGELRKTFGT